MQGHPNETRSRIAAPPWLQEPATRAVLAALAAGGAEARFVGGAVRDALLGRPSADPGPAAEPGEDIDIATPAAPDRVVELLRQAGIKVVPTGLAHGTVTAVAPPRRFEITTLRRDVETDGRRARVAFDADWAKDAARRDFTINAIFLGPDGTLYDPVGGLADLAAGRVRFVGDPATRIAEDVLRLLRYYRFEARFGAGKPAPAKAGGDAAARSACRAAAHLLPSLSAERVAQELMRLLDSPGAWAALQMMHEDGVLAVVLPEARRLDRLARMIAAEPEPDRLRRLAALVEVDRQSAASLAQRLRFANAWRDRLQRLAPPWRLDPEGDRRARRRALYRLGAEDFRDQALLLAAEGKISPARLAELLALAKSWTPPAFPLAGGDVTALGLPPGERIGRLLGKVRDWWKEEDFAPDRAQCLAYLREAAAAEDPPQHESRRHRCS
jgi:poly(A) polymerase